MARFNYDFTKLLLRELLSSDFKYLHVLMHDGVILVQFDAIHAVKLDKALLVFRVLELCEVISLNKRIESNGHVELFYLVSC